MTPEQKKKATTELEVLETSTKSIDETVAETQVETILSTDNVVIPVKDDAS